MGTDPGREARGSVANSNAVASEVRRKHPVWSPLLRVGLPALLVGVLAWRLRDTRAPEGAPAVAAEGEGGSAADTASALPEAPSMAAAGSTARGPAQPGAGPKAALPPVEHPSLQSEYGTYGSLHEVRESVRSACMAFLREPEQLVHQALCWHVGDEWVEAPPLSRFMARGHEPGAAARNAVERVCADYEPLLRDAAMHAYGLLAHYAERYAQEHALLIPSDAPLPEFPPLGVADGEEHERHPRYVSRTMYPAGRWRVVVDFRSTDYPELEQALAHIDALKARRDEALEQALR